MDKYEFNIKVEQLKKLVNSGDYETAMKIADGIDWRRVSSVSLLSTVSEIYEKNMDFTEAKEILLIAFERAPIGKRLLYKLTQLALKEGNIEEAEAYYKEFYDIAAEDSRQHILRYMILKAKDAPIEQLIHSLETYNQIELNEKWMYELSELYHKAGDSENCIKMCDNIMLMFGIGKYVDKAIELKTEKEGYALTDYQQGLIDNRNIYAEKLKEVEAEYGSLDEDTQEDYAEDGSQNLKEIATSDNLDDKQYFNDEEQNSMDSEIAAHMRELDEQDELQEDEAISIEDDEEFDEISNPMYDEEDIIRQELSEEEPSEPESSEPEENLNTLATEEKINIDNQSSTNNKEKINMDIVIEGKTPQEGLSIAKLKLKEIHNFTGMDNQVAKIRASKLNEKGVAVSATRIVGKDLIIEEAGDLSANSVKEIIELISADAGKRSIIFIDNPMQVGKLLKKYPMLSDICILEKTENKDIVMPGLLNANDDIEDESLQKPDRDLKIKDTIDETVVEKTSIEKTEIDVKYAQLNTVDESRHEDELDIDEFAHYASDYAKDIDCSIAGKSMLALYERIEIMEEDNIPLTKKNAEALIEEAANKAEKPPLSKRFSGLFSAKYDKDGMLILKEEHFII